MSVLLDCPHCEGPLTREGAAYRCATGHTFDVAREGYVNLLGKGGLGDTQAMLTARRAFLARGYYEPLFDALASTVAAALIHAGGQAPVILDVGCGEGHALSRIAGAARDRGLTAALAGCDVSRDAARMTAKANPGACVFTADVWRRIYMPAAAVAVLVNVFAPRNWSEFARLVAPGGTVIVVVPQADHLAEARQRLALLDIPAGKADDIAQRSREHFELLATVPIEAPLELDARAVGDLARMTPNYWHLTPEQTAAIAAVEHLTTRAAFDVLTLRRRG